MLLLRHTVCGTLQGARSLSTRASAILSSLDIPVGAAELPGVYDGQWSGSGDVLESVCPTTGEVLARVRSVSG
jgi:aldehyde dehydrogenase family 7 protein A1